MIAATAIRRAAVVGGWGGYMHVLKNSLVATIITLSMSFVGGTAVGIPFMEWLVPGMTSTPEYRSAIVWGYIICGGLFFLVSSIILIYCPNSINAIVSYGSLVLWVGWAILTCRSPWTKNTVSMFSLIHVFTCLAIGTVVSFAARAATETALN